MPETLEALAVLVLALLPGALYVWSFERMLGAWGVRFSDRVLRFIGVSALMHALAAPVTYWVWKDLIRSGTLAAGEVSLVLWVVPLAYVGIPVVLGSLIGSATRRRRKWAKIFTGPDPAPRAWDHLFASRPDGWIRVKLKSGPWLGGAFARLGQIGSYAAGYPEEQDLYLVESVEIDPDTGAFEYDDKGRPIGRGSGILLRWEEIEYLEFIEA